MTMYQKIVSKNINWGFDGEEERLRYLKLRHVYHFTYVLSMTTILTELLWLLEIIFIGIYNYINNKEYYLYMFLFAVMAVITIISWKKRDGLWEAYHNVCLLNSKVITLKDWFLIRRYSKNLFKFARSNKCNNKCYETTYNIANVLNNSDVKIVWASIWDYSIQMKVGHAFLQKGEYIYDTNIRRTFKRDEYFQISECVVYKEFELTEYFENVYEMTSRIWEDFELWCKENATSAAND